MVWKIRIKVENELYLYTTNEYKLENGFISFFDKFGKKRIFSADPSILISMEEVQRYA